MSNQRPLIWFIHGANSSNMSFTYIKSQLPDHDFDYVDYDPVVSSKQILAQMSVRAEAENRDITIIGHSLGGVLGVAFAQTSSKIKQVVTLGSPFGGSKIAGYLRWVAPTQLFEDIHPSSTLMTAIKRAPLSTPVLSLVSTAGHNPFITEPNDGVVSVSSQTALVGPRYVMIPINHFEILLYPEVINHINSFVFD